MAEVWTLRIELDRGGEAVTLSLSAGGQLSAGHWIALAARPRPGAPPLVVAVGESPAQLEARVAALPAEQREAGLRELATLELRQPFAPETFEANPALAFVRFYAQRLLEAVALPGWRRQLRWARPAWRIALELPGLEAADPAEVKRFVAALHRLPECRVREVRLNGATAGA